MHLFLKKEKGVELIFQSENQAFKILRADSCTSDVETRMNFKKMDKYS